MDLVQVSEFSSDFSSSEDDEAVNAVLHRHLVKVHLSDSDGSDAEQSSDSHQLEVCISTVNKVPEPESTTPKATGEGTARKS